MAKLVYSGITSLDGYVADQDGAFDWSQPDEEVHTFINDLERPAGTYLYGRRMYELMTYWDAVPDLAAQPAFVQDFAALWGAADKIVYSRSLAAATTPRTRIERSFDPESVRRLKANAESDISVGGAELASQAIRAGLVDEYRQFLTPVIVGGGKPFLPGGTRLGLRLLDERRFGNGVVYLRYGTAA